MSQATWDQVDDYFTRLLVKPDSALTGAIDDAAAAGMPAISVSAPVGKMLGLLVAALGARRVLEVGTLAGFSTIWMARALPAGGKLITLEIDPKHAKLAQANLLRAGVADKVEVRVGAALDLLPQIAAESKSAAASSAAHAAAPFDLIFIDADKPNNPGYFEWALKLSRVGTLIVIDNVVRKGDVANAASADESVQGTRTVLEMISKEPRVTATALQIVGTKGYDGFAVVRVVK